MYIGVDIGGTKCAVVKGDNEGHILQKYKLKTQNFATTSQHIIEAIDRMITNDVTSIGISCGGPLDSKQGIVMSPPCLSDWVDYPITKVYQNRYHIPVFLQNDADACAVAEWKFGAGRGFQDVIFLTFGTGMGAGLIINGKLYSGSCDGAGEIGHVRLKEKGHVGYRKAGSVEGYCSGSGIEQYGKGTVKELADMARNGNPEAKAIFDQVGSDFGRAMAILVDLLNPQVIIGGSIFLRCHDLMEETMWKALREEAITRNLECLKIVTSKLGENVGDVAALCVAMQDY